MAQQVLNILLGQKAVNKNFSIKYLKPVGPSIEYVTAVAWRESIDGRNSLYKGELYLDMIPIFSIFFGYQFLNEITNSIQFVGMGVILSSAFLYSKT